MHRYRAPALGLPAALLLISSIACHARAPGAAESPPGCYRFDRPVSYSASGQREAADSAWYIIELRPDGGVNRPYLPSVPRGMYAARSDWRLSGDTLLLRVFDGLVGWEMALIADRDAYRGHGRYLSDARVIGQEPTIADFTAHRSSCGAAL